MLGPAKADTPKELLGNVGVSVEVEAMAKAQVMGDDGGWFDGWSGGVT